MEEEYNNVIHVKVLSHLSKIKPNLSMHYPMTLTVSLDLNCTYDVAPGVQTTETSA